jgi:hypothetical protein
MFNVYKNQQSRQTGSKNLMGPSTTLEVSTLIIAPPIWLLGWEMKNFVPD